MAGLQANVYASISITMTAAVVVLVLRMMARRMTKMRLWFDDYFAVVAFTFATAYCAVIVLATVRYCLGQNLDYNNDQQTWQKTHLLLWIGSLTYASSIASSKISFLCFYWRLFQFTSIRIPIQILLVTSVVWIIVRTFLTIFQCVPVEAIWDQRDCDSHRRINQSDFFFGSVLVHCLMDVMILVLPIFPVSQMHLSRSKKLGVVGLFSSGVVVCVASAFVLVESKTVKEGEDKLPRAAARNWLWAAVEVNMAVFSGSLPMLRPVVRRLFPSCMSSEDDRPTYEGCTGIRLSNITDAKSRQGGQASSARNVSRTWPNKPIWANDIEHGSGPSLGPAQVTPDEDVDDYDDDESDLWQARERDTGRIDTGRDNGLRAG